MNEEVRGGERKQLFVSANRSTSDRNAQGVALRKISLPIKRRVYSFSQRLCHIQHGQESGGDGGGMVLKQVTERTRDVWKCVLDRVIGDRNHRILLDAALLLISCLFKDFPRIKDSTQTTLQLFKSDISTSIVVLTFLLSTVFVQTKVVL